MHCSLILFCVSNICGDYPKNLSFSNKKRFFCILYRWLSFSLQCNLSSLLFYSLPSSHYIVFNHHYVLHLWWLLNMCSRGTILACHNYSKLLFLLFFIIYPQYFLGLIASPLVHPHCWYSPSLTMENMCLETTFMWCEGSTGKDGTGISLSSFIFSDFITWPWALIYGWFITALIFLLSSLTMKSMIKQQPQNSSSTIFRIAVASIRLELPSNFFGHSCYSDYYPLLSTASYFWKAF